MPLVALELIRASLVLVRCTSWELCGLFWFACARRLIELRFVLFSRVLLCGFLSLIRLAAEVSLHGEIKGPVCDIMRKQTNRTIIAVEPRSVPYSSSRGIRVK